MPRRIFFVGDEREEALDLIEPGRTGRCEMDMPARPFGEPVADQRGLVRGVVVHDEMDLETAWDGGLNLVEELAELGGAVAGIAFADDLARRILTTLSCSASGIFAICCDLMRPTITGLARTFQSTRTRRRRERYMP